MPKVKLLNVGQIMSWAQSQDIQFVRGDRAMPYVLKDKLFHYFVQRDGEFHLVMTSMHDLESFA